MSLHCGCWDWKKQNFHDGFSILAPSTSWTRTVTSAQKRFYFEFHARLTARCVQSSDTILKPITSTGGVLCVIRNNGRRCASKWRRRQVWCWRKHSRASWYSKGWQLFVLSPRHHLLMILEDYCKMFMLLFWANYTFQFKYQSTNKPWATTLHFFCVLAWWGKGWWESSTSKPLFLSNDIDSEGGENKALSAHGSLTSKILLPSTHILPSSCWNSIINAQIFTPILHKYIEASKCWRP